MYVLNIKDDTTTLTELNAIAAPAIRHDTFIIHSSCGKWSVA